MKLKTYIYILVVFALCSSCERWLETAPKDMLSKEVMLSTVKGSESLLMGAYGSMQATNLYGRNMICKPEIMADNCAIARGGYAFTDHYYNLLGSGCNIWANAYEIIAITNDIIKATGGLSVPAAEEKYRDRIKGEAHFLRALFYFDLLRSFAREPGQLVNNFDKGVPLVTEPFSGMGPDAFPERATIAKVWAQVELDLNTAFSLLDNNNAQNCPARANSFAAKALLARAYLYQSKWNDAVTAADWVIANKPVDLYDGSNFTAIYKSGVESLFQLNFTTAEAKGSSSLHAWYANLSTTDNSRVPDSEGYINGDNAMGEGELIISDNLYTLFTPEDKRNQLIVKAIYNGTKIRWNIKYNSWQGAYGQDNIPLIRIAELYLIRAEACLKLPTPDYTKARDDLDAIRLARGLAASTESNAELAAAVQTERRLELCFEGHRFFDLKRQGKDITKEAPAVMLPYSNFKVVAGIPVNEMSANKNLVNNPGYN